MSYPLLQLEGATVNFGATEALDGLDLSVNEGELLVLLGPSGCGKSTLLRAIAGLQPLDSGRVLLNGADLIGKRPDERGIGLMFQSEVLFPHFDVADNVEFGLRMQNWSRPEREQRVAEMLNLVGLSGFEKRDVAMLSGGEAQRVGLARSLAPRPKLLLLDEPFGALDRPLRERLVDELEPLLSAQDVTAIHVTHDHDEAFSLGHRLAVMFDGALAAVGTPEQVWSRPGLVEVARFLGYRNTFEIEQWQELAASTVPASTAEFEGCTHVGIRADLIQLHPISNNWLTTNPTGSDAVLRGTVASCRFAGAHYETQIAVTPQGQVELQVELEVHSEQAASFGTEVSLHIRSDALIPLNTLHS